MSMENIRDLFLEDETFEDARNKTPYCRGCFAA